MSTRSLRGSAAAFGWLLVAAVHAQPAARTDRPDPLDASAPVAPLTHRSALAAYRPAHDVPVGSWKDANDTVTRIGGWRAYAREPAAPSSAPAPARSPR
jgi:hypothetical protein